MSRRPGTAPEKDATPSAPENSEDKQKMLLAADAGHFSMIRALHLADLITELNGFCGFMSILCSMRYCLGPPDAFGTAWAALAFMPFGLFFDFMDGKVARWRHKSSLMGQELDSLADLISFGVAPAAFAFAVGLRTTLDTLVLSFFVLCGLTRLARFNVTVASLPKDATGKSKYFEGTPIPTTLAIALGMAVCLGQGRVLDDVPGGLWGVGEWGVHPVVGVFALRLQVQTRQESQDQSSSKVLQHLNITLASTGDLANERTLEYARRVDVVVDHSASCNRSGHLSLQCLPLAGIEASLFPDVKQALLGPSTCRGYITQGYEREGLPESIAQCDAHTIERDIWVLHMVVRHIFEERHQRHHTVLVINASLEYHSKPEGVVEGFLINDRNLRRPWAVAYEDVAFREGPLKNMGDGGDINWDWQGSFVRSDSSLLTFRPCVPGVVYKPHPWIAV